MTDPHDGWTPQPQEQVQPQPRNLFLIATGQDTGGWNWRIREAFRRCSDAWTARSMAASRTYIAYPEDLPFRQDTCLALYAEADVVHLQNQVAGWQLYDSGAGKPVVLQHHGTIFRNAHEALSAEAHRIGMTQIASTLDLSLLEPDVEWVPVPYQLAELARLRERHYQPSDAITISHAPTNRPIKGTDHFLQVYERLADRHNLRLELIEGVSWRECLERKATSDIFYDQLELGYGCNAVEAWGMGIPVVAGVADPKVRKAMVSRWGRLPFIEAIPDSLEATLERLIVSEAARKAGAERGREHFDRWHDERVVTPWLEQIYQDAQPVLPGPHRVAARVAYRAEIEAERAVRAAASQERALRHQTAREETRQARKAIRLTGERP